MALDWKKEEDMKRVIESLMDEPATAFTELLKALREEQAHWKALVPERLRAIYATYSERLFKQVMTPDTDTEATLFKMADFHSHLNEAALAVNEKNVELRAWIRGHRDMLESVVAVLEASACTRGVVNTTKQLPSSRPT